METVDGTKVKCKNEKPRIQLTKYLLFYVFCFYICMWFVRFQYAQCKKWMGHGTQLIKMSCCGSVALLTISQLTVINNIFVHTSFSPILVIIYNLFYITYIIYLYFGSCMCKERLFRISSFIFSSDIYLTKVSSVNRRNKSHLLLGPLLVVGAKNAPHPLGAKVRSRDGVV